MGNLYYFQAPSLSINADSQTAPKLGSIYYSLERLSGPLNQFEHAYLAANCVNETEITNFHASSEEGIAGGLGFNAGILQGLAGSADILYGFAKAKTTVYQCESLETKDFEPTDDFISDSIGLSPRVQRVLSNALPGKKRVFMITGLKIATGLRTSTSKTIQHGPMLKVGVDATAIGVPVTVGPEAELATVNTQRIDEGRSLNKIVFAYRVVRIKQRWDGRASWRHKTGGKYSVETDCSDEEEKSWVFEPLDEEDVDKDYPDSVRIQVSQAEDHREP
jgi:hypothetical protein